MARATTTWPTIWQSHRLPPRGILLLLLALLVAAGAAWGYLNGLFGQRQASGPAYQTAAVTRGNRVELTTQTCVLPHGAVSRTARLGEGKLRSISESGDDRDAHIIRRSPDEPADQG